MTDTRFTPIEECGVVGNLETVALVAPNGSVDWPPFPHVEERVERMVENGGGSLISMGATNSVRGAPYHAHSGAGRLGVHNLMQSLAAE